MKTFKQYLAESIKSNRFALKLAKQPTDEQVAAVESYLKRYDLQDLSDPHQVEVDSIDFYDIKNKDVWEMDFSIGSPVSAYVLLQELKLVLNVPENYLVVRGSNEPVEIYAEDEAFRGPAYDQTMVDGKMPAARLSTSRFYDDAEQPPVTNLYGDGYNKSFLEYLSNVADQRKTDHYEAPAPLFSWIDMDKAMAKDAVEGEDFNARFDTPKPVYKGKGKDAEPIDPKFLGRGGNFDDAASTNTKFLKDAKGNRVTISAPRANLKAEKVR